ncbi:molybdate ABC transporter substrate-binding protein [Leifsonia shinshuensis]|uniref:Molybdate transport system substrate-binding protein n=1 Tax=Leifsonia shinshuensis TaxID=150026 RepID=A0A853CUD2_9MICO|nr:molybdate ABC transporter substrate-binding protein [Leifsonia shinshuensis]NYJ24656.1 molybdate transport system substrate-binding protein [Leifsonia shinshuensis]
MRGRLGLGIAGAALAAVLFAATGCSADAGSAPPTQTPTKHAVTGTITVFAAASLSKTFTELGTEFEKANPGSTVRFSFGGSSDLVTQLSAGAPADVFASADRKNMDKAVSASVTSGEPADFATNVLAIAVPPGNPAHVTGWADLARPGLKVVVCAPQVPCGAATATVEAKTGVALKPVSQESSVTDVLGKVSSGEADAGIVYVTDVKGAGKSVDSVAFPEAKGVVNTYPIAAVRQGANFTGGAAFIAFVTGPEGRKVLAAAGFGTP